MLDLTPTPAPAMSPAVAQQAAFGLRHLIAADCARLAELRRQRVGAQCAPQAATLMRRIALAEADLAELGEWR